MSALPGKLQQGKNAERDACHYLQSRGLTLLEKNFYCRMGEIDLIMQDQHCIVFIEVRFRSRTDYGYAQETINKTKINKLIKAATYFLQKKNWLHKINSRFDIIAINATGPNQQIDWIKNAFTV